MDILCRCKWMAAFVLFFSPLSTGFAAEATTPVPTPVGRVVLIKGSGFKAVMQNKEQRILQKQSLIYLHDVLITDDKTQAEIVFTDNTLMTFHESSQFSVDTYNYQPKQKGKSVGKYVMTLTTGGFRSITGLIAKKNPDDYQVNSPVATIGVRGTDYAVYLHNNQLYACYYEGIPCVTNNSKDKKNAKQLCLNAKHPYAYIANAETPPVPVNQLPAMFKEKLQVVPAKVAPFSGGAGGGKSKPSKGGGGGNTNNFCITQ